MRIRFLYIIIAIAVLLTGTLAISAFAQDVNTETNVVIPECDNGIDDDGDGFIDYPNDPGCDSPTDLDETDPLAECEDGVDNDGDGKTDYPDDLGCSSSSDNDESDDPEEEDDTGGGGGGSSSIRLPFQDDEDKDGIPDELEDIELRDERERAQKIIRGVDFNGDGVVNIRDLSIFLYHFSQSRQVSPTSRYDLNGDGVLNLVDISIILYHWT